MSSVLASWHRSIAQNYQRAYCTGTLITEQSEKNIQIMQAGTGAQPTLTFYNSAGLFLNESGYAPGFYLFAYGDSAYTIQNQSGTNGINYTTWGESNHNVLHGDYYSADRVTKYTVNNKVFYENIYVLHINNKHFLRKILWFPPQNFSQPRINQTDSSKLLFRQFQLPLY